MNQSFSTTEFQDFIEKTLELWHVPGTAIAVVRNGEIILSKGFGLRNLDQNLSVTEDTLFPIASCTKAFTSMCIALLVDEGKLEWDKPLRHYLPDFKLHDQHATELMTPRDLLCHRSGLPRHDILWYGASFSRGEVFRRLQYLEPNRDFRSIWQYQNMMYMVAGYLVEKLVGVTWEAFVEHRIFEALGMTRSNTSTYITQNDADHSRPHLYRKGVLQEIPYYEADEREATGPAGNINSCIRDMAKWLLIHTHEGKIGAQPFISAHTLQEMHKPHIFIDDPQVRLRFGVEFFSYGLGWFLRSYKGQVVVSHGGNIDGFSSLVSFMPHQNLGVVVLSNGDGVFNGVPGVISNTIYDRLAGLEQTDWNSKYLQLFNERLEGEDRSTQQSTALRRQAPASHPIEEYLGDYEHPGYGVYSIRQSEHNLELLTNDKIVMPLEHYHFDIFEATLERFAMRFKLNFATDLQGNICGFSSQLEPMVKEVFFRRLPNRQLSDTIFLAQLTGEYEMLGMTLVVMIREGKLVASLPGEEHELVPYHGTEFNLKELTGFSIAFKQDESGVFSQAVVTQPGAVFIANRK